MLEVAQLHEEELKEKQKHTWFNPKYMYWNNSIYYSNLVLNENTWDKHSFASLNKSGEVIGFIEYCLDRQSNKADGLSIINFSDDIVTFGTDVRQAIDDIFVKFNIRKLGFSVVVGNPIESTYDKLTDKYGGKVIGTMEKETRLIDGNLYDYKMYEIFREEYMKRRK